MLEEYLSSGIIENNQIKQAIKRRKVFPCFFGSALKLLGTKELMEGIEKYGIVPTYADKFGAKIFKITRDEQGNRLTHLKITGGNLKIRDILTNGDLEEKVNQIRIYSGQKYDAVSEVVAGTICAVIGLTKTRPGEGLGIEKASIAPILEPVLSYQIILPEGCDPRVMMPKLRLIEEEEPELHIVWDEQLQEIGAQLMGEVQIEILQNMILTRFGIDVSFDSGKIVYKETIADIAEGIGHFEPLRHYAEVHLLLEPLESGSGIYFDSNCSEDILGKNWQRLVLTHLEEKEHKGVLTGSPITDVKITLVSGRSHNKHTEGGDFREATYRAVRHGLKVAKSVLLEPYYSYQLEIPEKMVGRAMMDIEKMCGVCELSHTDGEMALLVGSAPVLTMRNYQKEVIAYTKGAGRLFYSLKGYEPCHNQEEVMERIGYDSERDIGNPTGSVFCAHGTGFLVEWYDVKKYMHLESYLQSKEEVKEKQVQSPNKYKEESTISLDEIDKIINSTYYSNQGKKTDWKKRKTAQESYYAPVSPAIKPKETKEEYLLVDGYNIIYAWPELNELVDDNMDGARIKLLDILSNYQGTKKCKIIVVFDAYRIEGHREEMTKYQNIYMVFTKEAQTADQYIERFAHDNQKKYNIVVATSDGLQQIIIRGAGSSLLSARELKAEIEEVNDTLRQEYEENHIKGRNYLLDTLSPEAKKHMEELMKEGH
jgi:predicted RNA-binding protein with PIN domain